MESFFRWIIRFRWLVIALVLGTTVLTALPLQTLRIETDLEAYFPANDPVLDYSKVVEERFGIRDLILVGVVNDNRDENGVFNPRTLGIVKEFAEQIALLPGIKAVRDEDVASVATMDNITGTLDGMDVDPFMETIPHAPQALTALKQALFANSMFVNWIVSQDGTGLLIMAKMEPSERHARKLGQTDGRVYLQSATWSQATTSHRGPRRRSILPAAERSKSSSSEEGRHDMDHVLAPDLSWSLWEFYIVHIGACAASSCRWQLLWCQ